MTAIGQSIRSAGQKQTEASKSSPVSFSAPYYFPATQISDLFKVKFGGRHADWSGWKEQYS